MRFGQQTVLCALLMSCLGAANAQQDATANMPADAVPAPQSPALQSPAPQSKDGITYMSGGIGELEADAMKAAAGDYDLMLTFATRESGAYVADVNVDIADSQGNTVLSTVSEGPILLVDLPPGAYSVKAEASGHTVARKVRVSEGRGVVRAVLSYPQSLARDSAMDAAADVK